MRLRFTLTLFADGVAQQTQFTSYNEVLEPLSLPPILQLTWRNAP